MAFRVGILWLILWGALSWSMPVEARESVPENLDSLVLALGSRHFKECDTEKLDLLNKISQRYLNISIDTSQYYAQMLFDEAKRCGDVKYQIEGYVRLDNSYYYQGEYDKCCALCYEGLALADSVGDKKKMAEFYSSLGTGYGMRANATLADDYWNKAFNIYAQLGDTVNMVSVMNNMAINALNNDMFDVADSYSDTTIVLSQKINDKWRLAECYFIKAGALSSRYDLEDTQENIELLKLGINYLYISRNISQLGEEVFDVAKCDIYLVQNYVELSKIESSRSTILLDSCKTLLDEAYGICVRNGYDSLLDMYKNSRLGWLIMRHRYQEAKLYLDSLFTEYTADVENHGIEIEDTYNWYANLYGEMERYEDAFESSKQFHKWYRKNRQNDFASKSATNMAQTHFDVQMQARERETLARELQYIANTKIMITVLVAATMILLILLFSFWKSRRANKLLDEKNIELEQQKEEILTINDNLEHQRDLLRKTNSQITDSINYASLIQNAAMPSAKYLGEALGEHFVFFRPKDIVSGDFYWAHKGSNRKMVVIADCTGHGVPGGFISMLGISLLNEIVARYSHSNMLQDPQEGGETVISAARFLCDLRAMLRDALHQHGEEAENGDGMDIALIIIDNNTNTIHYAGAYRPLYIYHEGVLTKIEADRMHIGGEVSADLPFTNHELPLNVGDMAYIFSDGIVDQFGYDEKRGKEVKYTTRRLQELLDEINMLPCDQQLARLETAIDQWRSAGSRKEIEQTDDNILVGIRI